jgi:hypothetical protein
MPRRTRRCGGFPEVTPTGYSLAHILMQDALLDAIEDELQLITQASVELMPFLVIGAPLRHLHGIYNSAVVIHRSRAVTASVCPHPGDWRCGVKTSHPEAGQA